MGSDLWHEAVKHNYISNDEYIVPADSHRNLGNFTKRELNIYTIKAMKEFYLRPTYILNQIFKTLSRKEVEILIKGMRFLTSLHRTY
jgi:hypothetical protein